MIHVCFAGVTGWTAPPIVEALDAADDLVLTAGVARTAAGSPLTSIGASGPGMIHGSVAEALAGASVDVLVDFTSAQAVMQHAQTAVDAGVHVVIGTSGLSAEDFAALDRRARQREIGVFAAGNFSVMAALLLRSAQMAAEHLDQWEILDYASDTKPDVPSGTSRELADALAQVRRPRESLPLADLHGPVEARGAEVGGSRIHSVRLPSFVVSTEILFGGAGERLVIRHDPGQSPEPYAAGTILAIRKVADVPGVRRGLDTLLFGSPSRARDED